MSIKCIDKDATSHQSDGGPFWQSSPSSSVCIEPKSIYGRSSTQTSGFPSSPPTFAYTCTLLTNCRKSQSPAAKCTRHRDSHLRSKVLHPSSCIMAMHLFKTPACSSEMAKNLAAWLPMVWQCHNRQWPNTMCVCGIILNLHMSYLYTVKCSPWVCGLTPRCPKIVLKKPLPCPKTNLDVTPIPCAPWATITTTATTGSSSSSRRSSSSSSSSSSRGHLSAAAYTSYLHM